VILQSLSPGHPDDQHSPGHPQRPTGPTGIRDHCMGRPDGNRANRVGQPALTGSIVAALPSLSAPLRRFHELGFGHLEGELQLRRPGTARDACPILPARGTVALVAVLVARWRPPRGEPAEARRTPRDRPWRHPGRGREQWRGCGQAPQRCARRGCGRFNLVVLSTGRHARWPRAPVAPARRCHRSIARSTSASVARPR